MRRPGREGQIIESAQNDLVRHARSLETDRKTRSRAGEYLAWGVHLAQEALSAGAPVRQVLIGPRLGETEEGRGLLGRLDESGATLARVTTRVLESILEGCGDQGVLLILSMPDLGLSGMLAGAPSLLLVAHGIQDPGNLGSIARSCLAFGAGGLLTLEGCVDPFGSRAVRAGMGAHFRLPVAAARTADAIEALRGAGIQLVAAVPRGGDAPADIDLSLRTALFVGNEGTGLPEAVLEAASCRVHVPMAPGVASLNVHAASAVLLYEASRQRGFF